MQLSTTAEAFRARGRMVRLDGLDLFTVSVNDGAPGTPLVLLHGFPSSAFDFHRCLDPLAQGRRVVTFDYPGYGFSSKPRDYSYSLMEQADLVERLLRALQIPRAHLWAHDMSTSVTTELLARRDAGLLHFEVASVVFMNGSIHVEMAHLTPSQKLLRLPLLGPLAARLFRPAGFRLQLRRILGRPDAVSAAELDDMFALIRLNDGHLLLPKIICYVAERRRFAARWTHALCAFEDRPALVLWGARDPVAVPAIAERVAGELPQSKLVFMDALGHYPQMEDPAQVVAHVQTFLSQAGD